MTDMLSTGFVHRRNNGESFADIFNNGVIEIRSGVQPASASTPAARFSRSGASSASRR